MWTHAQRQDPGWTGGAADGAARRRHLHGPRISKSKRLSGLRETEPTFVVTDKNAARLDLRPLTSQKLSPRPVSKYTTPLETVSETFSGTLPFFSPAQMLKSSHDDTRKLSEKQQLRFPTDRVEDVCVWMLCLAGYRAASVIIALTDGELRENQFDMAQRQVTKPVPGNFLSPAPLLTEGSFARLAEHARWVPPFTAWAWRTSTKPRWSSWGFIKDLEL